MLACGSSGWNPLQIGCLLFGPAQRLPLSLGPCRRAAFLMTANRRWEVASAVIQCFLGRAGLPVGFLLVEGGLIGILPMPLSLAGWMPTVCCSIRLFSPSFVTSFEFSSHTSLLTRKKKEYVSHAVTVMSTCCLMHVGDAKTYQIRAIKMTGIDVASSMQAL